MMRELKKLKCWREKKKEERKKYRGCLKHGLWQTLSQKEMS